MIARIDGFEIEGTVQELNEFVREYIHRRALPSPGQVGQNYGSGATAAKPWEAGYKHPCDQPKCGRRFQTEHGLNIHRGNVHKVYTREEETPGDDLPLDEPAPQVEKANRPMNRDQLDELVLGHLYPIPQSVRDRMMQGKTLETLRTLIKADKDEVSRSLWRLNEKGLVQPDGDGRGPNGYMWFRSEVPT